MSSNNKNGKTIRWYDKNDNVSESMKRLQNLPDETKRQVATYLIEEVISRKPYCDMLPLDTHYLILSEDRRRRWYDLDEILHIFVELLRHTSDEQKLALSEMVDQFVATISETDDTTDK